MRLRLFPAPFLFAVVLAAAAVLVGTQIHASATASRVVGVQAMVPDDTTFPVQEGFENGSVAGSQFHSAVPTCVPGGCGWQVANTQTYSGIYVAFAPDVNNISDQLLVLNSPFSVPSNAVNATLSFWHKYSFEAPNYDGAVLETSTDAGATWSDVTTHSAFLFGGYTGPVNGGFHNPLATRPAWIGQQSTYTFTSISLLPYAGQSVQFRFRLGTDQAGTGAGWWIDQVQVAVTTSTACGTPAWSQRAPYPISIARAGVTAHQGIIYSFGGVSGAITVTNAYAYNPYTNVWSPIAALPAARSDASAVSDGNSVYVVGGRDAAGTATNTLWRYDPAADTYTTLAQSSTINPTIGAGVAYAVVEGAPAIVKASGLYHSGYSGAYEVYYISNNVWGTAYPFQPGAEWIAAATYRGSAYYAGGFPDTTATHVVFGSSSLIPPELPGPRWGAASDFLNGNWILAGGSVGGAVSDTAISWDPTTTAWVRIASMLQPRSMVGGASVGSAFYVVGGYDANGVTTNDLQEYLDLPCASPTPTVMVTNTPVMTATPTATNTPLSPTACPIEFSDVPTSNPFYAYVRCLACRGIVGGYGDGSFRPDSSVTRGQAAKFISNAAQYADVIPPSRQTFSDAPSSNPFWLYIERVYVHGIVGGYADGTFRPGIEVTRGQLAKFVSNAAIYSDPIPGTRQTFTDVPPPSPFWLFVERVYAHGVVGGYADGTFRPGNPVTRGQTSKFISNAFYPNCQTP